MPSPFTNVAVARAAKRLPLLRRLPLVELVLIAELAMLAKTHFERLTPAERRRLVLLLREARGRPANLSGSRHDELQALVAKLEPRVLLNEAARRFSPLGSWRG